MKYSEATWSRFGGRLISYISEYYCPFVKTDYNIELNMTQEEIFNEITSVQKIGELSPPLQKIALQLKNSEPTYWHDII